MAKSKVGRSLPRRHTRFTGLHTLLDPSTNSQSGKHLFPAQKGLVLLHIATNKVQSEIRYERAGDGQLYPHIYGPLNVDAVLNVAGFKPAKNGKFVLPKQGQNGQAFNME